MNARMHSDVRAYRNTFLIICGVALAIAVPYSIQQHIPHGIAGFFIAAALVEIAFYMTPGFAATRALFDRIEPPPLRSLALTLIFFMTPVKDAPQEPREGRGAHLDAVLLTQPLAAFL